MTLRTLIAGMALFAASPALAAPQSIDDLKAEVKADKAAVKDSEKDLKEIQKLQKKWERARTKDNDNKMARVDERIDAWMAEETIENRRDKNRARNEFVSRGGDPRALKKEEDRRGQTVKVSVRLKDDHKDYKGVRMHAEHTEELVNELRGIQPAFAFGTAGPGLYEMKSDLIANLVRGARNDIRRAKAELAEDERALERRR